MDFVSLSSIKSSLVKTVVAARNGRGAHSYYADGWRLDRGDTRACPPGWFEKDGSFTVVFQHKGTTTTSTYSILFGDWDAPDEMNVAINANNKLTCVVKEDNKVKTGKSENISGIPMGGLHVWRFENRDSGLEVFLDGQRCVKRGSITEKKRAYTVLKGYPTANNPFIVWETHQILPDISTQFHPNYMYEHKNVKFGVGTYVEFHGKWDSSPKIFLEGKEVSDSAGMRNPPGEQIITVKVFVKQFMMASSAKSSSLYFYGNVPVVTTIAVSNGAKPLYNLTCVVAAVHS